MDYMVVKHGDLFLLTDPKGDIQPGSEKGLYTHDTRVLDRYCLTFNGGPLALLHSSCEQDYLSTVYLTNTEEVNDGAVKLHRDSVEVKREQIVRDHVFYERMTFINYAREDVAATIGLTVGSQFNDLFEVRGIKRSARGHDLPPIVEAGHIQLGYVGLDDIERHVHVRCVAATSVSSDKFEIQSILIPDVPLIVEVVIQPEIAGELGTISSFSSALQDLLAEYAEWFEQGTRVTTDCDALNQMIERGLTDLKALTTDIGDGPFLVAGIPWFAVPFGRDSIIAALQLMMFHPEVARGTLRTLARLQGTQVDVSRCEQPGKILHELRRGEMANLNEVPFGRYYGSIDSTPLFLVLVVEYYRMTQDTSLVRELLPNILRAVEWLDTYADVDGDGLVEYHVEASHGLSVQSWKDSYDSMIHPTGEISASPMAVSEVQGYVYHAKAGLAEVLSAVNHDELADHLRHDAELLKERFDDAFWMADKNFYAIALDKDKHLVRTVTSDPGHCLWSGIVPETRVEAIVDRLLSPDMFSGWGIRTMSSSEPVYSPISYHNGSVWAHDNSLILLGLAKYGQTAAVNQLAGALLQASQQFTYQRLPELFCGHASDVGAVVAYPVACNPQAWAAGTPLLLVQAILGIEVFAPDRRIRLNPSWPAFVSRIEVSNLRVGDEVVSFVVERTLGIVEQSTSSFTIEWMA